MTYAAAAGTPDPLTHCARLGIKPASWNCRGTADPILPQQELQELLFFFSPHFLGPHSWHMEVPRLGAESELQLPAHVTAKATQDPSHHVRDLQLSAALGP